MGLTVILKRNNNLYVYFTITFFPVFLVLHWVTRAAGSIARGFCRWVLTGAVSSLLVVVTGVVRVRFTAAGAVPSTAAHKANTKPVIPDKSAVTSKSIASGNMDNETRGCLAHCQISDDEPHILFETLIKQIPAQTKLRKEMTCTRCFHKPVPY